MFRSLELKNFQSHKDTRLEFGPGVNVIIGTSDSGKSSIFRGLRWVMYNRPLGDAFCSHWAGKEATSVTLEMDNNTITRSRENNKQRYLLDGLDLTAFKTDVPEEVSQALNIDSVNFEQQFDRPFLLDNSPGEVAQYFNKIAHLEKIDISLKQLHQRNRANNQIKVELETRKKETEEELKKYAGLEALDSRLVVLERMEENNTKTGEHIVGLNEMIEQLISLSKSLMYEKEVTQAYNVVEECLLLASERNALNEQIYAIKEVEEQLTDDKGIDVVLTRIETTLEMEEQHSVLTNVSRELKSFIREIDTTNKDIVKAENRIKETEATLKQRMPSTCPLCGSNIKEEK